MYQDTRLINYLNGMATWDDNNKLIAMQEENRNKEREFTDRQNNIKHEQYKAERQFKYDQQMRLYKRSNELADQQISFNRKSAQFANDSLKEQTFERYQKLAFESASSLLKHRVAQQKNRQASRELQQGSYAQAAKHAIASQESLVKKLKKVGTVSARGPEGRSIKQEVGGWLAVSDREEAARAGMFKRAQEQVATKLYGLDFTAGVHLAKRDLTIKAQKATEVSIGKAAKRGVAEILMKWEGADMKADASRMLEPEMGPAAQPPEALPQMETFWPKPPGTTEEWVKEHYEGGTPLYTDPETGKEIFLQKKSFSKDWKKSNYAMGVAGVAGEGGGGYGGGGAGSSLGAQGTGAGTVISAVGGAMMAASAIGAATVGAGSALTGGMIGLGGLGSIGLAAAGPIGAGIMAVAALGSIFDWW